MKNIILFISLLLTLNLYSTPVNIPVINLPGVTTIAPAAISLTGLNENFYVDLTVPGLYPVDFGGYIENELSNNGINWLHVTGTSMLNSYTLKVNFRADINDTDSYRMLLFVSASGSRVGVLQPKCPGVYQLTSDRAIIIPDDATIFSLSGSEAARNYVLRRNGSQIQSKAGTGGTLTFSGGFGVGTYTASTQVGTQTLAMTGEVLLEDYTDLGEVLKFFSFENTPSLSPVVMEQILTELREGLPLDSLGQIYNISGITMISPEKYSSYYRDKCLRLMEYCRAGKVKYWDPEIDLEISSGLSGFTLKCLPNLSSEVRYSYLYLSSKDSSHLTIRKKANGRLLTYDATADKTYVRPGSPFNITLTGSQYKVKYDLFRGNVLAMSVTGTGDGFVFPNLTQPGVYTIRASYDGHEQDMGRILEIDDYNLVFNSITENTYLSSDGSKVTDKVFYDEWGRCIQSVSLAASPGGKDVIRPVEYDQAGRVSHNYLPYSVSGNGKIRLNYRQEQDDFYGAMYGANHCAYSDVVYDNTPGDRVVEQSAPGASWQLGGGHTAHFNSRKNAVADQVKRYQLSGSSVMLSGMWPAGSLRVKQTINPEGKEIYEYYDAENHLLAKEARISASDRRLTYYVYDTFGRLRYIIPPAQDALFGSGTKSLAELSAYCYYNEYDKEGRIYKQYIPGAGYVINLYDKRGRPVLSQDARMREEGPQKWAFTKYDAWDRPLIKGICYGTEAEHSGALLAQRVFGEERGVALHGYTNQVYPTGVAAGNCLMIYYYDDYAWPGQDGVAFSQGDAMGTERSGEIAGLLTGVKSRVLGVSSEQWLMGARYYDREYNVIQAVGQLYPSGQEITANVHDFAGRVVRAKVRQSVGGLVTEYNKYFTYDQRSRLLKVEQEITGDPQGRVILASCSYDELGRQQEKRLHNDAYTVNCDYNVSGQPTGVTSPDLTYQLFYDEMPVVAEGATARYDGNISCFRWKNATTGFRAYAYSYDDMGQLTQAAYREQNGGTWTNASGKYDVGGLTYDLNGNLKTLLRRDASGGVLHNLTYDYNLPGNGNAVSTVGLNGAVSGAYRYNPNGDLVMDGLSGNTIVYNDLNLPESIIHGSEKISYIYSASGEKLAMQVGSSLTYYRGVMVYSGNTVSHLLHPEGIVRKSGNGWLYNYMLCDHIGSVRVLLEANGSGLTAVQTTDYYPFGLSFAYNDLNRNKYLFSGKELQDGSLGGAMLNLYDFGSRFYSPILGRWFCQDPALQLVSPYGYCGNNPVCYVDPDGEFILGFFIGLFRGLLSGKNAIKEAWKTGVNETKIWLGLLTSGGGQSFWKQFGEVASRFTWQLPQTLLGFGFSHLVNYTSSAEVDFYGGATTVSSNWFSKSAVTLGSYINGPETLEADPNNSLFQHEYGHYLQSQNWGWGYLSKGGLPSLFSATGDNHKYYTTEQDANARAIKYFNKRGVLKVWNFEKFPIGTKSWNMTEIYKEGAKEFTDEFSTALDNAYAHSSFGNFISGFSPFGILITGIVNHNNHTWLEPDKPELQMTMGVVY